MRYLMAISLGLFGLVSATHAASLPRSTPYQVCFTPGGNCTQLLVNTLAQAHHTILVQAYSFTSTPLAKALADAKARGVDVKVILDKSQKTPRYTIVTYLQHHQIPVWIDYKPAIAHNKVMIIDDQIVETGSFNFTKAAQQRNAENMLILVSPTLAQAYTANWLTRQQVSRVAS